VLSLAASAEFGRVRRESVAARHEPRHSRWPCHPRAISSGHQRYPADTHGHFEEAVGLGRSPVTGVVEEEKLHGMQGVVASGLVTR
jgi:hypothetical protein